MLLSIITINLNNKAGLERTAQSIMNQIDKDYEWIVIDGGSTDGSLDIIRKYQNSISYWVSEKDGGIYHAMNKGIDVARGDYLNFLNSGDSYHIDNIIEIIRSKDTLDDILYGDIICTNKQGITIEERIFPEYIDLDFIINNNFCHQSIFYPKTCFKNRRYSYKYKYCADSELNINLFLNSYRFTKLCKVLVNYNLEGLTAQKKNECIEELIRCHKETIPKPIIDEHSRYESLFNNDLGRRFNDIIFSKRIYRYLLRLYIYILYIGFLSFFQNITHFNT